VPEQKSLAHVFPNTNIVCRPYLTIHDRSVLYEAEVVENELRYARRENKVILLMILPTEQLK